MSLRPDLPNRNLITAITSGVAACVALGSLALYLERPTGLTGATNEISAKIGRAQAIARQGNGGGAYATNAVCAGSEATASAQIARDLQQQAAAANLALTTLDVSPEGPVGNQGALVRISVNVAAKGSYESLISFTRRLSDARPQIFISSAELRSHVDFATLAFEGQMFCTNSRPLD